MEEEARANAEKVIMKDMRSCRRILSTTARRRRIPTQSPEVYGPNYYRYDEYVAPTRINASTFHTTRWLARIGTISLHVKLYLKSVVLCGKEGMGLAAAHGAIAEKLPLADVFFTIFFKLGRELWTSETDNRRLLTPFDIMRPWTRSPQSACDPNSKPGIRPTASMFRILAPEAIAIKYIPRRLAAEDTSAHPTSLDTVEQATC
eukprot:1332385-Amorphochlora_amoeboformis.AAC.1